MTTQDRYLSELFRIVKGALDLDVNKVRNYTAYLADKLETAGDAHAAARLRKLLSETDHSLQAARTSMRSVPVDGETRFPLLQTMARDAAEPMVLLPQEQQDVVDEFVSVAKSYALLEQADASAPLTLLLFGPPGCGKSRLARHIASALGLPLYMARLDGLISSFLGSTAKNIRAIFEFAASTPCVLFLDEFDAIAKLRDDSQELGELKRVVNSFLQNLDTLGADTVVLAATNHPQLLDAAVWRRFSYRLDLDLPDQATRERLWGIFLGESLSLGEREILADLSEGLSGGDIREVSIHLKRRLIVLRREPTLEDAFHTLLRIATVTPGGAVFLRTLRNLDAEARARALRERNPNLYSAAHLASLLGTSKSTAHRWTQRGGQNG
jgi:hypothetical protein